MNPVTKGSPVITLTTDFGWIDGFVGVMKGVILRINPQVTIVDITHDVAPQNIEQGAFLFANAFKYFPPNAIHVVVVDPGVGSARRPVAVQMGETRFVAPDNGILTPALRELGLRGTADVRMVHLNQPEFWLPRVSNTFHGRDIFSPVAAHLSLGVPLESLGEPITDLIQMKWCESSSRRMGNELVGRVVHIDRFGNLVTNIGEEMLAGIDYAHIVVTIRGRVLPGVKSTYSAVRSGEPLALISSSGHLEVAVRDGNAAQIFNSSFGDEVVVKSTYDLDKPFLLW